MAISWFLFAFLVAVFTYRGYRQGIWTAASRVLSLAVAYILALWLTPKLAPLIASHTVIQGLAAYVTAGLVLFLFTSTVLSVLLSALGRRRSGEKPSHLSASLGALVGVGIGSLTGLVAVFAVSYLTEVWPNRSVSLSDRPASGIERLARQAAEGLMIWIGQINKMDPTTAKMGAALVGEPRKVISHVQNLQRDPDIQALFSDAKNQAVLSSGDSDAIQDLPAFQRLLDNGDIQALMALSGVDSAGEDATSQLAAKLSQLWRRSLQVKNDEVMKRLLSNPEFRQQLEQGNPTALVNNDEFMKLLKALFQDLPESPAELTAEANTAKALEEQRPLYRWVDDDGNVHYSDREPTAETNVQK